MAAGKRAKAKASSAPGDANAVETQEVTGKAAEVQKTVDSTAAGFPIVGIGASAGDGRSTL